VHSFEIRPDFADIARHNVEAFFGGAGVEAWALTVGDVRRVPETAFDRIILDMLAPWECSTWSTGRSYRRGFDLLRGHHPAAVRTGGGAARAGRLHRAPAWESLVRDWHADGLAVRPDHRMIAHTAFLDHARRLAPGVVAPPGAASRARAEGVRRRSGPPSCRPSEGPRRA
jgi:tRNA (adenine57-N1/adenine58-N1)-methyltransferase